MNIAVEIWSGTERKIFPIMQISAEIEFRRTWTSLPRSRYLSRHATLPPLMGSVGD